MVDLEVLKSLLNSEELEAQICGNRVLNFEDLRDSAIYANGFTPDCQMMKWFWDIVLNDYTEE